MPTVPKSRTNVLVRCPSEGHALFLAAGEVDALLPDFRCIARRQDLQVRHQTALLDYFPISLELEVRPEQYVVPDRVVQNPRLLWNVSHSALQVRIDLRIDLTEYTVKRESARE